VITRFAPSPTGYLHIGHVLNAVYVWGVARQARGRVLLRIEDHDRQRSRPEYEAALRDDLAWLGFEADDESRQSERDRIYEEALARLRAKGLVYACDCTRKDIAGEHYPGTCRDKALPEGPGTGIRVRIESGEEPFDDMRLGPQTHTPSEQSGDILLRDRLGFWTYQFAATVDDFVQGVTHVIRGEDLLAATGRQIRLARLLGRDTPARFLHHPLIMKSRDQKISKADGDTGIRELRAAGWSPVRVIGEAAAGGRLVDAPRDLAIEDLVRLSFQGT
jgi:glutamyl-tRNA synthetase/glutamyl-Q tRNA(Asp) synthetase